MLNLLKNVSYCRELSSSRKQTNYDKYIQKNTLCVLKRTIFLDANTQTPSTKSQDKDIKGIYNTLDTKLSSIDAKNILQSKEKEAQHTINETLRSDLHTSTLRLFALEKIQEAQLNNLQRKKRQAFPFASSLFIFLLLSLTLLDANAFLNEPFYEEFDPIKNPERIVRIEDVRGINSIVDELTDVIDMIKNPDKYSSIGATMPRGILLTGEPGTGKTLLAKAIASECGIRFLSLSASSLETGFVGGGANNIRSLFNTARKYGQCIIFIDELDSIMSRTSSEKLFNGRYLMQTQNALLVEMDGFQSDDRITVIAATNFPQAIDDALKRPGRFDLQIHIPLPDLKGREDILDLYLKKVNVSQSFSVDDLRTIARATTGQSGAFLRDQVNTAAILASKRVIAQQIWNGTYEPSPVKSSDEITNIVKNPQRQTLLHRWKELKNWFLSSYLIKKIYNEENSGNKNIPSTNNKNITTRRLTDEENIRLEEDANNFFAEYDTKIKNLITQLKNIEKEILLDLPIVDKYAIHTNERWLNIFELIRNERERVLKEQNLSYGVELSDLEKAHELLSLGVKRLSFLNSAFDDIDKNRVAVTRCGPAIVSMLTPGANKIKKITIIPRGDQLGGMLTQDNNDSIEGEEENDRTSITKEQLLISIRIHLAERVAEEIIFGNKSLSGESGKGLEKSYNLAKKMITKWGFSTSNSVYSVKNLSLLSQLTRGEYDKEIEELLNIQKGIVIEMLQDHEAELRGLAHLLVHHETLTGEQIKQYLNTFKNTKNNNNTKDTLVDNDKYDKNGILEITTNGGPAVQNTKPSINI